jgi:hypothetical protein
MVDWGALGQVIWIAFAASLTLALAFTSGVILVGDDRSVTLRRVAGFALLGLCVAITAFALYVLFNK